MLILCGKRAKTPYYISEIQTYVHSLEELNYFVYNHIDKVYLDFFSNELFDFIEKELERSDLSSTLRQMSVQGKSLSELVRVFFEESYYYGPNDLSHAAASISNLNDLSPLERLNIAAAKAASDGKKSLAISLYKELLNKSKGEISDMKRAQVAFTIGGLYAKLFLCENANAYFSVAYKLYPNKTYIKAALSAALILEDEQALLAAIQDYDISSEALLEARKFAEKLKEDVKDAKEHADFLEKLEGDGIYSILQGLKERSRD